MKGRREDHQRAEEEQARRELEQHGRRWSTDPEIYKTLLIVVLGLILLYAWMS